MDDLFMLVLMLLSPCLQIQTRAFSPCNQFAHPSSASRARRGLAAANDVDESSSKERKPWDVLRFVSQSSKFVTPPSLPFVGREGSTRKVGPGETLWTPSSSSNFLSFAPLDDVVMGGASSSTIDNNTGIWTGTVTDANNGGFVGIRSTPFDSGLSLDMRGCKGIELRFRKGDGQRFKFVVRDSTEFNGICWSTEFDARRGAVRIPFRKQIPTIFANTITGKAFDNENVVGFQFAYSKFEYDGKLNQNFQLGNFALQILEIRSY